MTKDSSFAPSLLASVVIHLAALISVSVLMGHQSRLSTRDLIPISLLEPPQETNTTPARAKDSLIEKKKLRARAAAATGAKANAAKQKRTSIRSSLRLR